MNAEIVSKIEQWASDRNLILGADSKSQFLKLSSELGELVRGILAFDQVEIIDGIGDAFVVATIIARQNDINIKQAFENTPAHLAADIWVFSVIGSLGDAIAKGQRDLIRISLGSLARCLEDMASRRALKFDECIVSAYDSIKDRKGLMYNGVFVKSTDPRHDEIMAEIEFNNRPKAAS